MFEGPVRSLNSLDESKIDEWLVTVKRLLGVSVLIAAIPHQRGESKEGAQIRFMSLLNQQAAMSKMVIRVVVRDLNTRLERARISEPPNNLR